MKNLFASGEIIYGKNKKKLEEGSFAAEYIEYDEIDENTIYNAIGEISGRSVSVKFKVKAESYGDIQFRNSVRILMKSDLIQAEWEYYEINDL